MQRALHRDATQRFQHPFWSIPELVALVVEVCRRDDVISLTRVSRCVYGAAMDGLCCNVRVLQKFLKLLAPLNLNQNGEYDFAHNPTVTDWQRFSRACKRVRTLHYNPQGPHPYISDSAWHQFLVTNPYAQSQSMLFPHLTEIRWLNTRRPSQTIYSIHFMSQALRTLWLDAWSWSDSAAMLSGITVRAPNLSELWVSGMWMSPAQGISSDIEDLLVKMVQRLEHLGSLALPVELLSSRVFLTLADHPALTRLTQTRGPSSADFRIHKHLLASFPQSFRTLFKLHLQIPPETLVESLEASAGVINIESLSMTVPTFIPEADHRRCFSLIARSFPKLRELVVRVIPRTSFRIDVSTLRPLLGLNGLKHVHLEYTDELSRFCDQDMFEIASSWTQLEVFYLGWSRSRATPESDMRLTVAALAPFAENCPNMRRISLAVDASLPPSMPPSTDARFGRRFQHWDILSSAIDSEGTAISAISAFLLQIFAVGGTLGWFQLGQGVRQPQWLRLKNELENLRRARTD